MAEAKSPPRKRLKKSNNLSSNCLLSACFGSFSFSSDDEVDVGRWSTTKRSVAVKKRVSVSTGDDHVESEKAEAQRRYDIDKKSRKKMKMTSHNYNKLQSSSIDQQTSTEVDQNPSSEKHVDHLPSFSQNIDPIRAGAGAGAFTSFHRDTLALPPHRKKPSTRITGGDTAAAKKLDPVVGLSVVLVTMVIMIVWGRLCAILCTSAWFYFTSKFKSTTANLADTKLRPAPLRLDLESEEHKKKVVLEGFLERKRR